MEREPARKNLGTLFTSREREMDDRVTKRDTTQ